MVVIQNNNNKSTQGLGRLFSTAVYQSLGCMDNNAFNHNPNATIDDGSCCYSEGCTDASAVNYDSNACYDNGSCNYDIIGCMNPAYQEYDASATVNDQSMCLTLITVGCTDASQTTSAFGVTYNTYSNYGTYAQTCSNCGQDTTPNCCCIEHIPGCMNASATNHDNNATVDDGSCVYDILGCTNATAFNYDSNATMDDGTCCFYDGCTDPTALNYDATACYDDGSCNYPTPGCTDPTACNYNPAATTDDGSCVLPNGCTDASACNYDANATCDDGSCTYTSGCTDSNADNYDAAACSDDGSCIYTGCMDQNYLEYDASYNNDPGGLCITLIVYGCTDATAFNYNPAANVDNDSCVPFIPGCTDQTACNYNSAANTDDSSCTFPDGCTDPTAANYDPNANCDDGSCTYGVPGCTTPCWSNYNPNATIDDGSCGGTYTPNAYGAGGCTNPTACNYDANALCDDGSCVLPDGCTDPNATNFDPAATCDDGSCTPCINGCMDPNMGDFSVYATCHNPGSCNYGYGGNTWTGANDDTTHWVVNGDNTINSIQNSNIYITKNSGNSNNYVKLNTNAYLNKDLFRDTTTNWDGTGSYYMVQFDARTSPGDEVKMRIYADSPASSTITSSESIYYYGANNIYKTFYMFFEALPNTGNPNEGPNNYSLRTTSFNTGETVFIKNIKVRQNKLDINNISSVNVNSIIHPTNTDDGKYFYFEETDMNILLSAAGLGNDFTSGSTVDAIQVRGGLPIKAGTVKIWDDSSANSSPGDNSDTDSDSHGRWEPSNEAAADDWQVGDKIILTLP